MKKLGLLFLLFVGTLSVSAQQKVLSFFDENGTIRPETEELDANADTLVTVFHRKDDVVWSRVVYRIIDMRYKQNFQLYFPAIPDDPVYRSLFKVILDAIVDGMPIYDPDFRNFKPSFDKSKIVPPSKYTRGVYFVANDAEGQYETTDPETFLISYDSIADKIVFNNMRYQNFIRNQLKYLVQEVIFFDKHTSRLHRQIVAIAPIQPDAQQGNTPMEVMIRSIRFWILYKDLRPYLAKTYMIPLQNESRRVTFDDFFQKRLFTSYVVGDGNMYNRMILDYARTEEEAKREQARIENELLTFEQDLWEY